MPILFLQHQSNVMDHSWLLAKSHICKDKKLCLYVHKKNSTKLFWSCNSSLDKYIFHICMLPIVFYLFSLPKYSSSCQGNYKCYLFDVNQLLWSPKVIRVLNIMKIILLTLKQFGWLESKPKSENYSWR